MGSDIKNLRLTEDSYLQINYGDKGIKSVTYWGPRAPTKKIPQAKHRSMTLWNNQTAAIVIDELIALIERMELVE